MSKINFWIISVFTLACLLGISEAQYSSTDSGQFVILGAQYGTATRHASPATLPHSRLTRNRRGRAATAFHTARELHGSLLQSRSLVALLGCVLDQLSTLRKLREAPPCQEQVTLHNSPTPRAQWRCCF